eukprot:598196-Prymnesium_polylepis.1
MTTRTRQPRVAGTRRMVLAATVRVAPVALRTIHSLAPPPGGALPISWACVSGATMTAAPLACASHADAAAEAGSFAASSAAPIHSPPGDRRGAQRGWNTSLPRDDGLRAARGDMSLGEVSFGDVNGCRSMSVPPAPRPGRGPSIAALRGVTPSGRAVSGIGVAGASLGRSTRAEREPEGGASGTTSSRERSLAKPGITGTCAAAISYLQMYEVGARA